MANVRKQIELDEEAAVDLCKDILLALGLSENVVNRIEQSELLEMFTDAYEITATTKYIIIDANGAETILSKETAYEQAAKKNPLGIMAITTISEYLPASDMGCYGLIGKFEWLTTPSTRKLDAVSLGVSGSTYRWPSIVALDTYSSELSYKVTSTNLDTFYVNTSKNTPKDLNITGQGIYYTWELPKDESKTISCNKASAVCSDFIITIRAQVKLSNAYKPASFTVWAKYVHETSSFVIGTPSIGWSMSPNGVAISAPHFVGYSCVEYTSSNYNDHYPYVFINESYAAVSGTGKYPPNQIVTITAGERPGYAFSHWVVDWGIRNLTDSSSATTTFYMPYEAVCITAIWIPLPNG